MPERRWRRNTVKKKPRLLRDLLRGGASLYPKGTFAIKEEET
jgi:hypothetical protein